MLIPCQQRVPHLNQLDRLKWGLLLLTLTSATAQQPKSVDWDEAFADHSGTAPIHFVAQYQDARGSHQLEEWRDGLAHLRRRTDNRIDLHADATAKIVTGFPADYLWQVVDLDKKIDNRISSTAMLHTGMLYSYWSMSHVLTRPPGQVTVTPTDGPAPAQASGQSCVWFEIAPDGRPTTRACWSSALAIPLAMQTQTRDGRWETTFTVQTIDRKPISRAVFIVDTRTLQVRNLDQLAEDD